MEEGGSLETTDEWRVIQRMLDVKARQNLRVYLAFVETEAHAYNFYLRNATKCGIFFKAHKNGLLKNFQSMYCFSALEEC